MRSMSDPASKNSNGSPSILADNLWIRFLIRYHREEMTLRRAFVRLFDRLRKNRADAHKWREDYWALRGINIVARPGDVVGIIGSNGSGKTTLLKALAGILGTDRGSVTVHGKVGCLLSFGVGFNPLLSGRENVYLNGSILGLSRQTIDERFDDIVGFSDLGTFIDAPVRTYSAGMRGRLGFSVAVHLDPDVLILDEVLSVGDASFRERAGSILNRYRNSKDKTVVLASHSMSMIRSQCTKVYWIADGRVIMEGKPSEVTDAYLKYSHLNTIQIDLAENLPDEEEREAKAFWRHSQPLHLPYGNLGPVYARTLCKLIAATNPTSAYEFGCNTGRNLKLLSSLLKSPAKLGGLDINNEAVTFGRQKLHLEIDEGDESHLKTMPDAAWDVVFTVSSMVHIPRPNTIVDELVRVTGKYLCLYEPILPGRKGKILRVSNEGVQSRVSDFSYFHDYQEILAKAGMTLLYNQVLPAKAETIGPLYRLMLFAKGEAADQSLTSALRAARIR